MSGEQEGLPEGWTKAQLGEISSVNWGNTSITKKSYTDVGTTAFSASGPDGRLPNAEHFGDGIVVSAIGARCGRCFRATGSWTAIKNTITVTDADDDLIDWDYLFPFLNDRRRWPNKGGGQPFIALGGARKVQVPIPPLNEQRRIVARIESLQARSEAAKEALDAIPPLLEKFRQSVLAAAFRGDLTAAWRAQNPDVEPAAVLLERIRAERRTRWIADAAEKSRARAEARARKAGKPWTAADDAKVLDKERVKAAKKYQAPEPVDAEQEGLPELPEGWCWATVDELVVVSETGLVRSSKTQRSERFRGSAPYVRMQNYDATGRWFLDDVPFVAVTQAEVRRYELRRGDILFNTRNSYELVGKVAVWGENRKGFVFNNNLRRLRTAKAVLSEWVAVQMQAPGFRNRIRGAKSATTSVCAIYTSDLLKQAIAVPPLAEQASALRKASAAISFMYSAGDRHDKVEEQLSSLNQSILAKAFRGELVPQDPTDEPASVLLERIRAEREAAEAAKKAAKKTRGRKGR